MLQSKTACVPVPAQQNNTASNQSKHIAQPVDNHSEWHPIEVGAERANIMKCPKNALF